MHHFLYGGGARSGQNLSVISLTSWGAPKGGVLMSEGLLCKCP